MKKLLIFNLLILTLSANAQTPLYIPDTLSGVTINLLMHTDSAQFIAGKKTATLGFNANNYLGPTLILNNGNGVTINVTNHIGDTTTVHWHGLHVAPTNDGGPHTTVLPNATWSPSFTVMDKASTYWYHPHFHGKTAEQALKGAAGMIIVRDSAEAQLALPRNYGVDDIPVIIQSQQFNSLNAIMPRGMQDSLVLINGARANYNGNSVYVSLPAQVVRLRLLNAGGERTYNVGLLNNSSFKIIGTDGGLLNAPVTATRIMLAPGERAEILIDLTNMNGQTIQLISYAADIPMGTQGGPTMPMGPGNPPMDSPLNGVNFNLLQINVVAQTLVPITTIPTTLVTVTPYTDLQANITRTITMTAQNMMMMDGPFYFNNNLFDMMRVDYSIPLNTIEIWQLTNLTMVAHPFHIHDVQFYILDRDGNLPPIAERGRKDVVLVAPNETVRFITKFEDFADTLTPYMYHCHILMHEDDGMMGQFVIKPLSVTNSIVAVAPINNTSVYPNPATDYITIDNLEIGSKLCVVNSVGQEVYNQNKCISPNATLNTSGWARGIYSVHSTNLSNTTIQKLIIN